MPLKLYDDANRRTLLAWKNGAPTFFFMPGLLCGEYDQLRDGCPVRHTLENAIL